MKPLFFILAMTLCISGFSQKIMKRDSMSFITSGSDSWRIMFIPSVHTMFGAYDPERKQWEILDTMGLLNELYRQLEEANKRAARNDALHHAANDCLIHLPDYFNKASIATFDKYINRYKKLLKQK